MPIATIIFPPAPGECGEIGIGRIEPGRNFFTPRVKRAPFDIIERIGGEILHKKSGYAEHAQMRVILRVCGRAFLAFEAGVHDQAAPGRIRRRHPHAKRFGAIRQRRRIFVSAVDHFQGRDLPVRETGCGGGVLGIRIDVSQDIVWKPRDCDPRSPWLMSKMARHAM